MKKFYFLLIAMMVGFVANAADYYALHGQITGNPNWESVLLTEKDGWYEYTGTFVAGNFGIKELGSANVNDQTGWIGGGANFTKADTEQSFTAGGNSESTLAGNYTFRYNPTTQKAIFVTYTGEITVKETYAIHGQITGNTNWESTDMTLTDGKWTVTIDNAVAGKFGIKRMENGSQKDWYAADGASIIEESGDYKAKIDGTNWTSSLTGKVTFSFDPAALILTVTTEGGDTPTPPVTDYTKWYVNVIGVFNDWKDNGVAATAEGLSTHSELAIGTSEFKVKIWNGTTDAYYSTGGAIPTGVWVKVDGNAEANMTIEGATATSVYKVEWNCATSSIKVTPVGDEPTPVEYPTLAVVGTMNGWDITAGTPMTREGETYTATFDALPAATEFKIATPGEKWTLSYGGEGVLGDDTVTTYELTADTDANAWSGSSVNFLITKPYVNVTITFVYVKDGACTVKFSGTADTGVENIAADNAPVEYFNLQGVRVDNPENGIFIRRQGNKVSKVIR